LEDAHFKFEIWTDYKNLEYFMKAQKLNWRQAQWALYLSRFNFILKHVLGTKMGKADGLSRRLDWKVSQIRYSLVVILKLNGVSEVQYKGVMMIDDGKYQ